MLTFVVNPYPNKSTYCCIIFVKIDDTFDKVCQQNDFKTQLEAALWGIEKANYYGEGYSYEVFDE